MERHSCRNLILKVILDGLYDEECHLSKLRGFYHILKYIWIDIRNYWRKHINLPDEDEEWTWRRWQTVKADKMHPSYTYMAPMSHINQFDSYEYPEFPSPSGININMMPFLCGKTFEECKLPDNLLPYWDLIHLCIGHHWHRDNHHLWPKRKYPSDLGKVYYLTIQESEVESGQSQRRPGLHVDSPGGVRIKNQDSLTGNQMGNKGSGSSRKYNDHRWGAGSCHVFNLGTEADKDLFEVFEENLCVTFGGIYIASNVPNSTRAWNCAVDDVVVGQHGDIEHLRSALPGEGEVLRPGQVYWITDRTPHESLPLKKRTPRQFLRIVTSEVSFWFKDHSTTNPLGVLPDSTITKIAVGNKFSVEGVDILSCETSSSPTDNISKSNSKES